MVIGRGLIGFVLALAALTLPALGQTCRWDGTAPFCDGSCGGVETEITRLGGIPDFWVPPFVNQNPPFGANCATGTKALCCAQRGMVCRWDGTAPFCDGGCRPGETVGTPPPGSSSGSACVTGSKTYCCRSTASTGTVRSPLTSGAKFTRYAAVFEQKPGPAWQARHGLTSAQYQRAFDELTRQGYRPVDISGYSVDGKEAYAAVFEQRQGPGWAARHGLTPAAYQQAFDQLVGQGHRPVRVSGYDAGGGQERYAAIFEQGAGPPFVARHGLTSAQYQQEFDRLTAQGYRLADVSGHAAGGQDRYAAIFEQRPGPAWAARHGLTSAQYQQAFNELAQQGYRPVAVRGWRSGEGARYAAIWEKAEGSAFVARHGLTSDAYQEEFDRLTKAGYRLRDVSGYRVQD